MSQITSWFFTLHSVLLR